MIAIHADNTDGAICVTHYIAHAGAGKYVKRYKSRGGLARAAKRVAHWTKEHGSVFVDVEQIYALMAESLQLRLGAP